MREDYVEKQIEQLGKVLRAMLLRLSGQGLEPEIEIEKDRFVQASILPFDSNKVEDWSLIKTDNAFENAAWSSENEVIFIELLMQRAESLHGVERLKMIALIEKLIGEIAKKRATISVSLFLHHEKLKHLSRIN